MLIPVCLSSGSFTIPFLGTLLLLLLHSGTAW